MRTSNSWVMLFVTGYQRISRERSTAAFGFRLISEQLNRQMHSDLASFSGRASSWFAYEYQFEYG